MDSQLKQRLIGAAVLIALAVIFVPMFLSSPPPKAPGETVNLDIPPPPERQFQTQVLTNEPPKPAPAAPTAPAATGGDKVAMVDTATAPRENAPVARSWRLACT